MDEEQYNLLSMDQAYVKQVPKGTMVLPSGLVLVIESQKSIARPTKLHANVAQRRRVELLSTKTCAPRGSQRELPILN